MERDNKIIEMYNSNISASDISKELKIGRKTVYRALERHNITLHKYRPNNCLLCGIECKKKLCGTCNTNLRRYRTKKLAVEYLGGKCKCGWSGDVSGFDFHHRNPEEKSFNISGLKLASISWEEAKVELNKCDLLCALCHRLEHSMYGKLEELSLEYKGKIFI